MCIQVITHHLEAFNYIHFHQLQLCIHIKCKNIFTPNACQYKYLFNLSIHNTYFALLLSRWSIHPLCVTALSILWGWSQSQLSLGYVRVHPGQVASSSQGPHWWQRPSCKVPTAHQEQFGVQYLAQGHFDMQLSSAWSWDLNQQPSDN